MATRNLGNVRALISSTTPPTNKNLIWQDTSSIPYTKKVWNNDLLIWEEINPATSTGESNTASNVGLGAGLYKEKVGVELRFKSITAGSNISISEQQDQVVISSSGKHSIENEGTTVTPANILNFLGFKITYDSVNGKIVIDKGETSNTITQTLVELQAITGYKDGNSVFVADKLSWYKFDAGSEAGIQPDDGGTGSWVQYAQFSGLISDSIHNATTKTTPVDADEFGIWDSVSSALRKVTWANIKSTLKTYFDSIYATIAEAGLWEPELITAATTEHPRWDDSGDPNIYGTDKFGFGALPAGLRSSSGGFNGLGSIFYTWVDTSSGPVTAVTKYLQFGNSLIQEISTYDKAIGLPLRLVRAYTPTDGTKTDGRILPGTFTDGDGNTYDGVIIGDQVWSTTNLKTTTYSDGTTAIPTGYNDTDWSNLTTGAYAVYDYTLVTGIDSEAEMIAAYGLLYNWYAVDNVLGLATNGSVPTDAEFTELTDYIIANYPSIDATNIGDTLKSIRQVNSPFEAESDVYIKPKDNELTGTQRLVKAEWIEGLQNLVSSKEKNPFTETIEIANLLQHSPTYNQTSILNIVKGTGSFIGGTYQVLINTNGSAINFSSDFIVFNNDYSTLTTGQYLFIFAYLPDGKIGVTISFDDSDITAPTIQSATVEDYDPDALVVVFSEPVTITDTTGLSLNFTAGTAKTLTGTVSGSGTNTLTFALSAAIENGDEFSFEVASNNNIEDLSGNNLTTTSQNVITSTIAMWEQLSANVSSTNGTIKKIGGVSAWDEGGITTNLFSGNFQFVWFQEFGGRIIIGTTLTNTITDYSFNDIYNGVFIQDNLINDSYRDGIKITDIDQSGALNSYFKFRRDSGITKLQVSTDNINYNDVYTYPDFNADDVRIKICINDVDSGVSNANYL